MKLLKRFILLVSISLLVAGCGGQSSETSVKSKDNLQKIRVALDTAAGGSLQVRAAVVNGYLKKRGIQAEIANFAYGIDTINALLTGQTDTGMAADYALLNSLNKGDFVIVSSLTGSNDEKNSLDYSEILAVKGINSPKDLKGKNIGVAQGTVFEYHWARYLEHIGISEKEINYVPYSTPDEAIVGVKNGDIDAVIASGSLLEKFKSIEGVHTIDKLSSVKGLNVSSYLLVDRKFAEENTELIGQLILGIKEGIGFVKKDPKATAKIAYDELKISEEDALRDLKRQNFTLGFTKENYEHLTDMKEYLLRTGKLKEDYNLDSKLFLEPAKQVIPELVTYEK